MVHAGSNTATVDINMSKKVAEHTWGSCRRLAFVQWHTVGTFGSLIALPEL